MLRYARNDGGIRTVSLLHPIALASRKTDGHFDLRYPAGSNRRERKVSGDQESAAAASAQVPAQTADRAPSVRGEAAVAIGAAVIGALALGALAVGVLAIGRLAIGKLALGRARLRSGTVDELRIARLTIGELRIERMPERR